MAHTHEQIQERAKEHAQTGKELLRIDNLSIGFLQDRTVVPTIKNVDLYINEGETVSIVGESGSGKTVTCRSMLGLVPRPPAVYTGGHIWYDGKDLVSLTKKEWPAIRGSQISMVFQDPMTALNPVFTIGKQMENVYLYQGKQSVYSRLSKNKKVMKQEARARSLYLLEKMELPDPEGMLERYPFELSGGQRQRIIIALAMIHTPRLLICDEPATALDVTVQASINKELVRLVKEEGISMVYITHNLGVAKEVSDRTYVMRLGEVVEKGSTEDVFLRPQHPYTQSLLDALPRVTGKPISQQAEVIS